MFSEQEFQSWSVLLDFTKETVSTIQKIRTSPPSRSVRSSKKNLSGKYPSKKMGMSIQYESYTVELVAMYVMEYDDDVLEYYDQPITLKLDYSRENGKRIAFYYTPDFLVLRKDGAQIEEWKTEEQLIKLSEKDPVRYFKDEEGNWRCPPAEIAASQLGLDFVVRSSAEIDINVHRNLIQEETEFLKNHVFLVTGPASILTEWGESYKILDKKQFMGELNIVVYDKDHVVKKLPENCKRTELSLQDIIVYITEMEGLV